MNDAELQYIAQAFFLSLSKEQKAMWETVMKAYHNDQSLSRLSYRAAVLFAVTSPGTPVHVLGLGRPVIMSDLWQEVVEMSNSPFGETFRLYHGSSLTDAIVTGQNFTLFCQPKEE